MTGRSPLPTDTTLPGTSRLLKLDRQLLAREPGLPGLRRVLDPTATAELLAAGGWELPRGAGSVLAVRLRWKPGTSVRAAVTVETDAGVEVLLVVAVAADGAGKLRRLHGAAVAAGARAHLVHAERVVVADSRADPALGLLAELQREPAGSLAGELGIAGLSLHPMAYNPARRWVGLACAADGEPVTVVKLHAAAPVGGPVERAATAAGYPVVPRLAEARNGRAATYPFLRRHRAADPVADRAASRAVIRDLQRLAPPPTAEVRTRAGLIGDCARATASLTAIWPAQGRRLEALLPALSRAMPANGRDRVVVHGDLSPDQVLVPHSSASPVLCDLDRAGLGQACWDDATWDAALVASGRQLEQWPPEPDAAAQHAAAAILRAVEPFRRRDPQWPRMTNALVDTAVAILSTTPGTGDSR